MGLGIVDVSEFVELLCRARFAALIRARRRRPARSALLALIGMLWILTFPAITQAQQGFRINPADLERLLNAGRSSLR